MKAGQSKDDSAGYNNINNNTNNVNVNVKLESPKRRSTKSTAPKKEEAGWFKKAIIGGCIALVVSVIGLFVKQSMEENNNPTPTSITPDGQALEGEKQN